MAHRWCVSGAFPGDEMTRYVGVQSNFLGDFRSQLDIRITENQTTPVSTSWSLNAHVCSLAVSKIGSDYFMYVVFCNMSFIAFTRIDPAQSNTPVPKSLGSFQILTGQNQTGWSDGFQYQASFNHELYLAMDDSQTHLVVVDRLNCLLREVEIYTPGHYLTRTYTLYGVPPRSVNEFVCGGSGALVDPRLIFRVANGYGFMLVTSDPTGNCDVLWQLDTLKKQLTQVWTTSGNSDINLDVI